MIMAVMSAVSLDEEEGKMSDSPDILILNLIFTIILIKIIVHIYTVSFSMHGSNVGPFDVYNELSTVNDSWILHFQ